MTKAAKKANRQVEPRNLDSLIVYGRNARTHSDGQIGQIMASLGEFGWTNPVLIDEKNNIIAGHARVEAARRLGMAEVPCIVLDGLTEAQKRAHLIGGQQAGAQRRVERGAPEGRTARPQGHGLRP